MKIEIFRCKKLGIIIKIFYEEKNYENYLGYFECDYYFYNVSLDCWIYFYVLIMKKPR